MRLKSAGSFLENTCSLLEHNNKGTRYIQDNTKCQFVKQTLRKNILKITFCIFCCGVLVAMESLESKLLLLHARVSLLVAVGRLYR